ncbi:MAG: hypothetical protein HY682_01500 [Chloroflexi bacterium]|nr:hypothetical protein [Chloroflexota bacterium]
MEQETLPPVPIADGAIAGLALNEAGNVYAAARSSVPGATGVWRITPGGSVVQYASLPAAGFPNGLAFDRAGNLYVSDSAKGIVWRVTQNGSVVSLPPSRLRSIRRSATFPRTTDHRPRTLCGDGPGIATPA